jgi:hypothetical protein
MPNLVNSGSSIGGSGASAIVTWDPTKEEFKIGDKFYGFQYYPANAKLIVQEILEPSTITNEYDTGVNVVSIPKHRLGDTFTPDNEYYDPSNHDIYKNWLTSQAELTFSWYTGYEKNLIVEVA